jgi:photosystem II stability/assembly factor-like uncharacterized protein
MSISWREKVLLGIMVILALTISLVSCMKMDRSKFKPPKITMIVPNNLHCVVAVDANNIWAFGNYGTIIHTSDGGKNWEKQESGFEGVLPKAQLINLKTGWICGTEGTILYTTNGGKKWVRGTTNTDRYIVDLSFVDDRHGFAVGESMTMLKTVDGGKTWETMIKEEEKEDVHLSGVWFVDPLCGWVVGEFSTILHTKDGGKTWKKQVCENIKPKVDETQWEKPDPALLNVYFLDKKRGWIQGMDGVIVITENGGEKWTRISNVTEYSLYNMQILDKHGWMVGDKGTYLISEDGGKTWKVQDDVIKTKFWLRDVSFSDEKDGWVVGYRGTIANTKDMGKTFTMISGLSYDMPEFGITDF